MEQIKRRKPIPQPDNYPIGPYIEVTENLRAEIRRHNRETRKPEDLPGRDETKPRVNDGFVIVTGFDVSRPTGPYIYCALCGMGHYQGYIIWFRDQWLRTIGHNCGHTHFGAGFREAVDAFTEAESRRLRIDQLNEISKLLPEVLGEIMGGPLELAAGRCEAFMRRLGDEMPKLYDGLFNVVRREDGFLSILRRRDKGVRSVISDAVRSASGRGRVAEDEYSPVGQINAGALFKGALGAKGLVNRARARLLAVKRALSEKSTEDMSVEDQKRILDEARLAVRDLSDVRDKLAQMPGFVSPQSTIAIVKHFNDRAGETVYSPVNRGFRLHDGAISVDVVLDARFAPFTFEKIPAFAYVISAAF